MSQDLTTDLNRPGIRAEWATVFFAVGQVVLSFAFIYQNWVIARYLNGAADDAALDQSDVVINVTAIGFVLVLLVVLIINGRFLYLAARHAQAIAPREDAISPGWAVGWYLIPIANLWMPYRAMKETLERLVPGEAAHPSWLPFWWGSWVFMSIADRLLGQSGSPPTLEEYASLNVYFILSGFGWIVPSYLFLQLVRRLRRSNEQLTKVFD